MSVSVDSVPWDEAFCCDSPLPFTYWDRNHDWQTQNFKIPGKTARSCCCSSRLHRLSLLSKPQLLHGYCVTSRGLLRKGVRHSACAAFFALFLKVYLLYRLNISTSEKYDWNRAKILHCFWDKAGLSVVYLEIIGLGPKAMLLLKLFSFQWLVARTTSLHL